MLALKHVKSPPDAILREDVLYTIPVPEAGIFFCLRPLPLY